jgi:hypothetical protein
MKLSRISHSPITCAFLLLTGVVVAAAGGTPNDSSPLRVKAAWFQQDLLDKHWLDGLYVSIVPSAPPGTKLEHTIEEPGNVIHAGVWKGRYLAGVGYQYAVTRDPWVRRHGGQILEALRILQEVTGKPGLLARGYVKGHGPVEDWERNGADSKEWHQGQGSYADYRWYGDVRSKCHPVLTIDTKSTSEWGKCRLVRPLSHIPRAAQSGQPPKFLRSSPESEG